MSAVLAYHGKGDFVFCTGFQIGMALLGLAALSGAILLGNYIFNKVGSKKCDDAPSTSVTVNTVDQDHLRQHVTVRS